MVYGVRQARSSFGDCFALGPGGRCGRQCFGEVDVAVRGRNGRCGKRLRGGGERQRVWRCGVGEEER